MPKLDDDIEWFHEWFDEWRKIAEHYNDSPQVEFALFLRAKIEKERTEAINLLANSIGELAEAIMKMRSPK